MWYKIENNKIILDVYIQPGAKQSGIVGIYDGNLKIKLQAPPIEGKANKMLLKFIAQLFKVPIKKITLLKGHKSKHKQLQIINSTIHPSTLDK